MKRNRIFISLLLSGILLGVILAPSDMVMAESSTQTINIYIFWGEGCPHCAAAKPFLEELAGSDPRIGYYDFEVYYDEANRDLFVEFASAYGFEPSVVPTIFVAEKYWLGFTENIKTEISTYIDGCLSGELLCSDPGSVVLAQTPEGINIHTETSTPEAATPTPTAKPTQAPTPTAPEVETPAETGDFIKLPFFGVVDLSEQSLLISTLVISFVDGFNPCSIWVLSMLLAITLNTNSRKKVLIIGLVFILVTGLIYAAFIGGLFTIFKYINFMGWIRIIVAVVALIFALVNIKDYFWYKEGISFTISDDKKPGIYKGIRKVARAEGASLWAMIAGTVVLAAGVSLVEFSCTAGFPVLWTNLLASQNIPGIVFVGFLLIYMVVYQLDELVIFLVSVFTLRKSRLEEKHGRILKLLGGMLMFVLAIAMLVNPAVMNNLSHSLIVFGAAFGLTAVILLVHRVILPRLGITLGSEK